MIKLVNVCKSYGEKVVLNGVSAEFKDGGSYCVSAPSGAGKTTLFRIILGLETPDSGEVYADTAPAPAFQEPRLCPNLSVAANIRLTSRRKLKTPDIERTLESLGLFGVARQAARTLSGGQRTRAAVARALLSGLDALILDEPFAGLDADAKTLVINALKSSGKTLIYSTHDLGDAERLGSVIFTLK